MNRQAVALGLLGAFLITSMPSVAAPPPVLKGEAYDHARARIIKLGYRPVRFLRTEDGCMLDPTCKRYPELLGCSAIRPAQCTFAFVGRRQEYLVVATRGEKRRVESITSPSLRERSRWPMTRH